MARNDGGDKQQPADVARSALVVALRDAIVALERLECAIREAEHARVIIRGYREVSMVYHVRGLRTRLERMMEDTKSVWLFDR